MPAKRLQRAEGRPSEAAVLERHFFSDALPQVGGFPIGTVQTVANKSARTNMFILCAWYFFQQFEQNPALAERFDHVCHVWSDCLGLPILSPRLLARHGCDMEKGCSKFVWSHNFHSAEGVRVWVFQPRKPGEDREIPCEIHWSSSHSR